MAPDIIDGSFENEPERSGELLNELLGAKSSLQGLTRLCPQSGSSTLNSTEQGPFMVTPMQMEEPQIITVQPTPTDGAVPIEGLSDLPFSYAPALTSQFASSDSQIYPPGIAPSYKAFADLDSTSFSEFFTPGFIPETLESDDVSVALLPDLSIGNTRYSKDYSEDALSWTEPPNDVPLSSQTYDLAPLISKLEAFYLHLRSQQLLGNVAKGPPDCGCPYPSHLRRAIDDGIQILSHVKITLDRVALWSTQHLCPAQSRSHGQGQADGPWNRRGRANYSASKLGDGHPGDDYNTYAIPTEKEVFRASSQEAESHSTTGDRRNCYNCHIWCCGRPDAKFLGRGDGKGLFAAANGATHPAHRRTTACGFYRAVRISTKGLALTPADLLWLWLGAILFVVRRRFKNHNGLKARQT